MEDENIPSEITEDVAPSVETTEEIIIEETKSEVAEIEKQLPEEKQSELEERFDAIYERLNELDRRTIGNTDITNNADKPLATDTPNAREGQEEIHQEKQPEPTKWWFRKWKRD